MYEINEVIETLIIMPKKRFININGFTFIELLVVLGIFVIVMAAAVPAYSGLHASSLLNEDVSQVVQMMRMAREYSRAGMHDSAYGVYFEINPSSSSRIILYKGDSFAARSAGFDQTMTIDSVITMTSTISGNEINFVQESGLPSDYGDIYFLAKNRQDKTVVINGQGFVMVD